MRHRLLVVLLFVVISPGFGLTPVGAQAGHVNITGTWVLQYIPSRGTGGPIKMTFVFKQEGEKLSGTFSGVGPWGAQKVTGTVKGNQAVFGWELEDPQATTTVTFKGTIESATKMTGSVGSPFCGTGCKWTAIKQKK